MGAEQSAAKPTMQIDGALGHHPTAIVVWLAYVTKLALDHPNLDQERLADFRIYAPTFDAEFAARENQIAVWDQLKAKQPDLSNGYMSDLEAIAHAGFMKEYVWEYYGQVGWTRPAGLRIDAFDAWQAQHLPKLTAVRYARLKI